MIAKIMNTDLPEENMAKIKAAVFAGNKIEAIKLFRDATGKGLAEAKDSIEHLTSELRATDPEKFSSRPPAKGCVGLLIFIGLVVLAVLLRLIRHPGA